MTDLILYKRYSIKTRIGSNTGQFDGELILNNPSNVILRTQDYGDVYIATPVIASIRPIMIIFPS